MYMTPSPQEQLNCNSWSMVNASCVHKANSKPVVIWSFMEKWLYVFKFIDIGDLWLRSLKGRHAEVKLGEWGCGKCCALGCPAKSSVFPDQAASSYTGKHLSVLLFPFGGYLCLLGFHHSGSTGHVQVSCAIQVCLAGSWWLTVAEMCALAKSCSWYS